MRSLIDRLPDAVFVLGDQGIIRFANRAAVGLLGDASRDVTGSLLPFVARDGEQFDFEAPSGPVRILARTSTIPWEGQPARLLSLRLSTDQDALGLEGRMGEKLEALGIATARLRRKEAELSRVAAELERFVYFASHDLKSPLRAVDSLAGWIEEDLADLLEGETAEHMTLLRGRVRRMDQLLDDILLYSRAGRTTAEPEEIDVGLMVGELRLLLDVPDGIKIVAHESLPVLTTSRGLLVPQLLTRSPRSRPRRLSRVGPVGTTRSHNHRRPITSTSARADILRPCPADPSSSST